jgi:predicted acyltransferase
MLNTDNTSIIARMMPKPMVKRAATLISFFVVSMLCSLDRIRDNRHHISPVTFCEIYKLNKIHSYFLSEITSHRLLKLYYSETAKSPLKWHTDLQSGMRINSIDAVRGLTVAAMLLVNDAGDWSHIYPWLEHAEWHGCTPADFIFPVFMLIVGVSISLALGRQLDAGAAAAPLARAVLLRGARIVLLGVALNVISMLLLDGRGFRLLGVLQRTGICFAAAGLLAIYMRSARAQWAALSALLLGYSALLAAGGSVEPGLNLADRIDTALLGSLSYQYDAATGLAHEPEGLLSTLPSLGTVILGLRKGETRTLPIAGAAAMLLGWLWSLALPLNKQLWTSSFVLWTGGFGMLAIALAHRLIDVRGWPAFGRAMGINAIAAYAGSWIATCLLAYSGVLGPLYEHGFRMPLTPLLGPEGASAAFAACFTAMFWIAAAYAGKRGWRVTI